MSAWLRDNQPRFVNIVRERERERETDCQGPCHDTAVDDVLPICASRYQMS